MQSASGANPKTTYRGSKIAHFFQANRWLLEILLVLGAYAAYSLTQGNLPVKAVLAFRNAYEIINLEQHLKIFHELSIQSWVLNYSYLINLANSIYTYLFYPVLIPFAIWIYIQHRPRYELIRNTFLISAGLGLICFALYPLAPPRMMSDFGFVDTLAKYAVLNYSASIPSPLVNQYAAMPSFHFGWTLLAGTATILIARHWWLKAAGGLLSMLMFYSIIATANHYFLDAAGGAIVILLAYGIALMIQKIRNKAAGVTT